MVLPAPTANDAHREDAAWTARVLTALRLATRSILILVDDAHPARIADLVRAVYPLDNNVDVLTKATDLPRVSPGSTVVLALRASDAAWLNMERPLVSDLQLRVLFFADRTASAALARDAPDLFHWISHRVVCPPGPMPWAVRQARRAFCARARGIAWRGHDWDGVFPAAFPGRSSRTISVSDSYADLVLVASQRREWQVWQGIHDEVDARRARWALADAGRRAKTVWMTDLVAPDGFVTITDAGLDLDDAKQMLASAGAQRPGRLAALCELDPDGVADAVQRLRGAESEHAITLALLDRRFSPEPMRPGSSTPRATSADETLIGAARSDTQRTPELVDLAVQAGDAQVALHWAKRLWTSSAPEHAAHRAQGRALLLAGDYQRAEHSLTQAEQAARSAGKGARVLRLSCLHDLALTFEAQGLNLAAARQLSEAIRLGKTWRLCDTGQYQSLLAMAAAQAENLAQLDEAIAHLGRGGAATEQLRLLAVLDKGSLLRKQGAEDALSLLEEGLDAATTAVTRIHPLSASFQLEITELLLRQDRELERAQTCVEEALATLTRLLPRAHPKVRVARRLRATVLFRLGRFDAAEQELLDLAKSAGLESNVEDPLTFPASLDEGAAIEDVLALLRLVSGLHGEAAKLTTSATALRARAERARIRWESGIHKG